MAWTQSEDHVGDETVRDQGNFGNTDALMQELKNIKSDVEIIKSEVSEIKDQLKMIGEYVKHGMPKNIPSPSAQQMPGDAGVEHEGENNAKVEIDSEAAVKDDVADKDTAPEEGDADMGESFPSSGDKDMEKNVKSSTQSDLREMEDEGDMMDAVNEVSHVYTRSRKNKRMRTGAGNLKSPYVIPKEIRNRRQGTQMTPKASTETMIQVNDPFNL